MLSRAQADDEFDLQNHHFFEELEAPGFVAPRRLYFRGSEARQRRKKPSNE
jgi:hypothetical protein